MMARAIASIHVAFALYVVLGSLLVLRWPGLLWVHLLAVVWAIITLTTDAGCPLTWWEKAFWRKGGVEPYTEGFLQHHIFRREFTPAKSRQYHIALGAGALALNLAIYAAVFLMR